MVRGLCKTKEAVFQALQQCQVTCTVHTVSLPLGSR